MLRDKSPKSLSIRFIFGTLVTATIIAAATMTAPAVAAATITVTGTGDALTTNGICTMREAVINANNDAATWPDCAAGSGTDTIVLPAGTITLSIPNSPSPFSAEELSVTGDLDLTSSLIINGDPGGTTINGGALDRIFDINPDTDFNPGTPSITVAINNLTITNGYQNDVGAIRVQPNATVTIANCTVSNSVSWANDAGAIGVLSGGTLAMTNCTVSGNSSLLLAGAIKNEGNLTLASCTVTNNHTSSLTAARGQSIGGYGTAVILRNTIVAGSAAGRPDMEGSFESQGYNIIGSINDGTGNIAAITPNPGTADQIGINAALINLGPLQNNGGPTPTHALGAGSIAIDKGNSFGAITDQRGEVRPCDDATISNASGGDGSDVGAFEAGGCAANSAPDAVDDSANLTEDSGANTIAVLGNDTDPDSDALTITIVTQGTHGAVAIGGGGANVTYTPNADFFGNDSFTYTINDGHGHSDTATVNVIVANVEDPPLANNDTATIMEDSGANSINVLGNDTDVDGDTLLVTAVTQGSHGSSAITGGGTGLTYTPAHDFFGNDSFNYTISDGHGGTSTATVNVTVLNVNDPPIANNDNYNMNQDTTLNVPTPGALINDTDVDGDSLTATLVSGPSHALSFSFNSNGSFMYTPAASFTGIDVFSYRTNDGTVNSNVATVTIHIADTQAPSITASVSDSSLWPPNHNLINVGFTFSVSDNSGGPIATQVSIFSNEDDVTAESGDFSPDAKNIGSGTLRLRSERAGGGDGRVYLVVITATDPSNNVRHTCLTVVVPHSQSGSDANVVNALAAAAKNYCDTHNGAAPPGYFVVGDGPVVGPKQ